MAIIKNNLVSNRPKEDENFHLSNRLLFRMFKTTNVLHTVGTSWTQDVNLTTQQWSVIGALSRPGFEKGMGVGELSNFLQVTRQNLTGLLDRLERQNITQRVINPNDGRAKLVQLTEAGWDVWDVLAPKLSSFYQSALNDFTPEEMTHFLFFIDKLQANLRKIQS
ncbi:MAG: MarR family transcriptional regulator [Rhizobiaceae bacterium]